MNFGIVDPDKWWAPLSWTKQWEVMEFWHNFTFSKSKAQNSGPKREEEVLNNGTASQVMKSRRSSISHLHVFQTKSHLKLTHKFKI